MKYQMKVYITLVWLYGCINIDSVMKMGKKHYPGVYSEEYKYYIKNKKMPEFIDAELELDFGSDSG